MTVSRVLAVCGLTAAVSCALAVQPQTPPKPDTTRPDNTRPDNARPDPSRNDPNNPSRSDRSVSDEAGRLKQLEGRWKVEVSIDPAMWNPHLFKDDARPGSDENKPGKSPSGKSPSDKPASDAPSARTPDGAPAGSKVVTGYSNVKLILGDRVLQETTVLPDMKAKMDRGMDRDSSTDDKPARQSGKAAGDEKFKGVSLLSFNENDRTYSMVFVDNCQGEMRHCTGTYEAGANRIVFNAAPHGHDKDAQHKPDSSTSDHSKWQAASGMQVVLEFVSPDEHRVTMYASGMTAEPNRVKPTTGAPGDGNNPGASPGVSPKSGVPATDRPSHPMNDAAGKVVYQAVYRRASGADLDKFRDALRLSDAAER